MAGNHVLLETIQLTQSAASVTFDNIPQTGYTDLKIVMSTRNDAGTSYNDGKMTFNGSSTGYSSKLLYGNGSGTGSASASYGFAYWVNGTPTPSYTSNTFSNTEVYIPNYTSSNYKSVSSDTVAENNATLGVQGMTANLWSNTSAITSITFSQDYGNYVANSTFSLYGIAATGTTPAVAPKATGGNIVANDGTYWYHAFLSSGTFTPQTPLTADAIIVGAGGGGGSDVGGGAGAGRVYNLTALSMASATNYVCTIGAGGVPVPSANAGLKGTDSSLIGGLLSYTSLGGGGGNGRQYGTAALNDGWNGGGGGYDASRGPTAGNGGFAGGSTVNPGSNPTYSGGGGGAAEAGNTDGTGQGGDGINTYSTWHTATNTGVSGYIAGGGGGGMYGSSTSNAAGGDGGGGFGGDNDQGGANGVANTGSGGGGAGSSQVGGTGGSGLIIIRYPMAS